MKPPAVFKQAAFASHGLEAHSLVSVQDDVPSPVKPVLQAQTKPPPLTMLVQKALLAHGFIEHSSTSVHPVVGSKGLPENPELQAHPKDPALLEQDAFGPQGLEEHSLISVHVVPSPVKPVDAK